MVVAISQKKFDVFPERLKPAILPMTAQIAQAILIGGAAGYAGWIYNSPTRDYDASLPWVFYALSGGAAAAIEVVSMYRIYRSCCIQNPRTSWVIHPLYATLAGTAPPVVALVIAQSRAKKIFASIQEANMHNQTWLGQQLLKLTKIEGDCYRAVYDKRNEITLPSCYVCEDNDRDAVYPTFYQALPVDWTSKILCAPSEMDKYNRWKKITNFTDNATDGQWPCLKEYYNPYAADYGAKTYVASIFQISPPWEVIVEPLNETCLFVNATGIRRSYPGPIMCFEQNQETVRSLLPCTTREGIAFAATVSLALDASVWDTKTTYHVTPDAVSKLLYEQGPKLQLNYGLLGIGLVIFAIFSRLFIIHCHKPKRAHEIEMGNLVEAGAL